jgi:hypothetical protein
MSHVDLNFFSHLYMSHVWTETQRQMGSPNSLLRNHFECLLRPSKLDVQFQDLTFGFVDCYVLSVRHVRLCGASKRTHVPFALPGHIW